MVKTGIHQEKRFTGLPVSDGLAYAPIDLLHKALGDRVPNYSIPKAAVPQEITRLREAAAAAAARLDDLIVRVTHQIGEAHANIFMAQKMIVMDVVLMESAIRLIEEELVNAETACVRVLNDFEAKLLAVDDEYLKGRASDIGEVRHRLLEIFQTQKQEPETKEAPQESARPPRIIVASELNPGDTVGFDAKTVAGFLTERGGSASHSAILSRALGIPAVSGIKGITEAVQPGDYVLINGHTGEVIINPLPSTLNLYPVLRRNVAIHRRQAVAPIEGFRVMANINTVDDLPSVLEMQAEGIGLYRTEFEFIAADKILSEDEQYDRYARVIEAMQGKPVSIRLADIGADKAARFLNLPPEDNPVLGYRGARLLLGHPELLVTQARALVRASEIAPINIIYPMIVDVQQFYTLREIFRQSTADLGIGQIRHGVMFEVPAACICAREILQAAEFGSIGSNDLIQYLFAVDRDNDLVAYDYNPDRPAFWRLLINIIEAAREAEAPLSFCGEMGGQPQYLPKLMEIGIRTVSISSRLMGLARLTARNYLGRHTT